MKPFFTMRTIKLALLFALVARLTLAATAAPAAGVDNNIYNYLQLLRSEFNSAKVEVVNRIMKLSAEDAKKFWPVYREYENELGKQAVSRAEFIVEFIQAHKDGTFDDAKAKDMAKGWFKLQRARLDLLEKYYEKIEKSLSAVQAGQFLQIENQIFIFIDLTIAAEMPLVGEKIPRLKPYERIQVNSFLGRRSLLNSQRS
jgi:Spy/CpxP family protein refolding chaperone